MKTRRLVLIISLVCVGMAAVAILIFSQPASGGTGMPNTDDGKLIEEAILYSRTVDIWVAVEHDFSLLDTIYINDPRGGELWEDYKQIVLKSGTLQHDGYIGYLDYRRAFSKCQYEGGILFDSVFATAKAEDRSLNIDEINSLYVCNDFNAAPPIKLENMDTDFEWIIYSIEIDGDVANAVVDIGLTTNRMTLVKVNDKWYIAMSEVIQRHP